ncbi:uncharacterized protein UTRI_06390 [Ustilago trichophora]|uniref:Rho-GAP domain-containing protein n=1 Tax=Ustilago trichophora TaxID=86804 RepID=A0A5C3EK76_9BASI|nr:uncharacterized protein UTRI_06390 [Ustilago trichophora]
MAAVAPSTSILAVGQGAPSRKHSASSSQPSTTERMTARKLFGRPRKAVPSTSELSSDVDSNGHTNGGYASSPFHSNYASTNAPSHQDDADDKIFSSRDTNLSTSALSSVSTASRTSRFFRRFGRQKPPPVPSLPPALVLDLDAGTAVPRSSHAAAVGTASAGRSNHIMTGSSQPPTAAAAIIAQSNAAYAVAETIPKPKGIQRKKMLEAITNARINVGQARDLVRMCGLQIRERGLDTSGLFRPFRIAESSDHVYHMIQLFLLSIDISTYIAVFPILPENALDRFGRNNTSTSHGNANANGDRGQDAKTKVAHEELDKELRYAAPHDIVSVMKWGLRHMRLRTTDFNSKDADEWYDVFVAAERESDYHARAIADLLHPKLPQATAELLSEVLDLMASVAAHSSSNHMPASALCKVLGFWLFGRIGVAHPPPTVDELIEAVNKASAMAEHLLLAHIRSQAAVTFSMPLRLTELVQRYPYIKPGAETPSLPPAFASRTVPTLRIDLRSENLVVSQAKPRSPSSTLADALDASASHSITGGHGEMWAAVMMQLDHLGSSDGATSKGHELLIDEHVRILRQVDQELFGANEESDATQQQQQQQQNGTSSFTSASSSAEVKANRRRSQSLSDLRSNFVVPNTARHPLAPLPESNSNGTNTPRGTPRRKPVPLLDAALLAEAEALEVVTDAAPVQPQSQLHSQPQPQPQPQKHQDLFSGGLEPSASWRSFSEEGFGGMSTASSDLSLSEFDLKPVQTLPSRRSNRSLYRVRSSTSNSSRRRTTPLSAAPTTSSVDGPAKPTHTVTAATFPTIDPSLAILWQDTLLDASPCARLPPLLLVQLNSRTASAINVDSQQGEMEMIPRYPSDTPWLLVVETIIPPRPPTPPMPQGGRGGEDAERTSLFAPSMKSVRMRLRRVSTVIGNGVGMRRKVSAGDQGGNVER